MKNILPYLFLSIMYGPIVLCLIYILTPLGKNFPKRKLIIATAIIPFLYLFSILFEHWGTGINILFFVTYSIAAILFLINIGFFIKDHAKWTYYIYMLILLLSIGWSFYINWSMLFTCFMGSCI